MSRISNICLSFVEPVPKQFLGEYGILKTQALKSTPVQIAPKLVHLCGVPGSGKSTYAQNLLRQLNNFYLLDFDRIMSALLGYQEQVKQEGLEAAFRNWEIPARNLGYNLLVELLRKRRSIIFDHSAANQQHLEILKISKNLGYSTEMHHLPCQPEIALARIESRSVHQSRFTPAHLVLERSTAIKQLLPKYRELVDRFLVLNTAHFSDDVVNS